MMCFKHIIKEGHKERKKKEAPVGAGGFGIILSFFFLF